MEIVAYVFFGIVAGCWILAMVAGMIVAFPFGLIGLAGITGVGLLLIKVIKERLENKEDDYYSDNVDQ